MYNKYIYICTYNICVCMLLICFAIVMYFSNGFNNHFIIGPPAWPSVMTNTIIRYVHTHTKDTYKFYIVRFDYVIAIKLSLPAYGTVKSVL